MDPNIPIFSSYVLTKKAGRKFLSPNLVATSDGGVGWAENKQRAQTRRRAPGAGLTESTRILRYVQFSYQKKEEISETDNNLRNY